MLTRFEFSSYGYVCGNTQHTRTGWNAQLRLVHRTLAINYEETEQRHQVQC